MGHNSLLSRTNGGTQDMEYQEESILCINFKLNNVQFRGHVFRDLVSVSWPHLAESVEIPRVVAEIIDGIHLLPAAWGFICDRCLHSFRTLPSYPATLS